MTARAAINAALDAAGITLGGDIIEAEWGFMIPVQPTEAGNPPGSVDRFLNALRQTGQGYVAVWNSAQHCIDVYVKD